MNLSALKTEKPLEEPNFDNTDLLRKKEAEYVQILDALGLVIKSHGWKELKTLIFDDLADRIERQLITEAKKDELDTKAIYQLQGKLNIAKKFSSLEELVKEYKPKLQNIRQQLNGK